MDDSATCLARGAEEKLNMPATEQSAKKAKLEPASAIPVKTEEEKGLPATEQSAKKAKLEPASAIPVATEEKKGLPATGQSAKKAKLEPASAIPVKTEEEKRLAKYLKREAKKRAKMTPEQLKQSEFKNRLQQYSGQGDVVAAMQVYDEMKAQDLPPDRYMLSMLLALCGNAGLDRKSDAVRVFTDMKERKIQLEEGAYTPMIKLYSLAGEPDKGYELLQEMKQIKAKLRLRTYSHLLCACCLAQKEETASELMKEMRAQSPPILPTEKEYVAVLSMYSAASKGDEFYSTLAEFREDIFQPTEVTWAVMREWFMKEKANGITPGDGGAAAGSWRVSDEASVDSTGMCSACATRLISIDVTDEQRQKLLAQVEGLACGTLDEKTGGKIPQHVAAEQSRNNKNGAGGAGGAGDAGDAGGGGGNPGKGKYSNGDQKKVHSNELKKGGGKQNGAGKNAKRKRGGASVSETEARRNQFQTYKEWLERKGKTNFDVIIDGANVAYYNQNYEGSAFSYQQIDSMVRHFQVCVCFCVWVCFCVCVGVWVCVWSCLWSCLRSQSY
jgi:pentatricopeptide repeat protein